MQEFIYIMQEHNKYEYNRHMAFTIFINLSGSTALFTYDFVAGLVNTVKVSNLVMAVLQCYSYLLEILYFYTILYEFYIYC